MSRLSAKSLLLTPLAAAAVCILTTGCANMVTTAGPTNAFTAAGTVKGNVHGGSQFLAGAAINLYRVGTNGYGTGSNLLARTTSDANGSFSFTQVASGGGLMPANNYTCPNANTLLYVAAIGGNTQGTGTYNNPASVMVAPVGVCSAAASKFIVINEVSTVATVTALQQYINPGTSAGTFTIGTNGDYTATNPVQAGTGLINAFNTIANLEIQGQGYALTQTTVAGTSTNATGAVVTITPETAKINTLGNILAACVNSTATSSAGCTSLFNNATPPVPANTSQPAATFATAVDTLQAMYYMATNPIDDTPATTSNYPANLTNLYNLAAAAGAPFAPVLTAVPTDWTIGIVYNAGATKCANGAPFINYPYANSIDATGNIWMANGGSGTTGALTQMSPTGTPLNCSGIIFQSRGGAAIDTLGNVWGASNTTAAVYKFDGTTTSTITTPTVKNYAIAADGTGHVFFTENSGYNLYELPATAVTGATPLLIGPVTTVSAPSPYDLAVDSKGTVVIGQSGGGGNIISAYPTTTVGGTVYPATPTTITSAAAYAGVYGIAFDKTGGFWVGNSAGTSFSADTPPGNTTSRTAVAYGSTTAGAANTVTFTPPTTASPISAGGLSTARINAVDGAGNVWFANNTAGSAGGTNTLYSVSEISNGLVALSPTAVTTATNGSTTTATQNGGFQKPATFFSGLRGIAIDPSGNVWTSSTASTGNTFMTEVVGAAVPVITPISAQIAGGTFATKP